jgi:hypothetical protein
MLSDEDPQFAAAIKYPSTVQSILIKLCLPPTGEKSLAVEVLLVGKTIVLEPVVNDIVILLNKLYQIKSTTPNLNSSVSFDMDIESELGCVVFDEIHMINDESRGHVWEQCIMLLPSHIQMIGLSATLDNPEKFAFWLETKGDISKPVEKEVYLTRKLVRAVPLIHYSFITVTNSVNKVVKDKAVQAQIKDLTNKPYVIQDEKGKFNDVNYQNMTKMLQLFEKNDIRVKRQHVLNKVTEYLVQNEAIDEYIVDFKHEIKARLQGFYDGLKNMKAAGFSVDAIPPQAAIYLTIKLDLVGKTKANGVTLNATEDVAAYVLNEAKVAIVPFYVFGSPRTSPWFRLSVGTTTQQDVQDAIASLRKALEKLS